MATTPQWRSSNSSTATSTPRVSIPGRCRKRRPRRKPPRRSDRLLLKFMKGRRLASPFLLNSPRALTLRCLRGDGLAPEPAQLAGAVAGQMATVIAIAPGREVAVYIGTGENTSMGADDILLNPHDG